MVKYIGKSRAAQDSVWQAFPELLMLTRNEISQASRQYVCVHLHIRPFFYGEYLGRYGYAKTFGRLWSELLYIQVIPVLMLWQTIGPEYIYFLFCSSNNSVRITVIFWKRRSCSFQNLCSKLRLEKIRGLK